MKKEIGGYLELEESTGQEYYPELCGVNLGRTALLWLMEVRNCKKIYLPTSSTSNDRPEDAIPESYMFLFLEP